MLKVEPPARVGFGLGSIVSGRRGPSGPKKLDLSFGANTGKKKTLNLSVGVLLSRTPCRCGEIAFGFAGVICWAAAAFMTFLHIRSVKQAESEQEPSKPQAAAPDV